MRLPIPYRQVLDRTYRFRATLPGNWHRALRKCLEWYRDNPLEVPGEPDPAH